MACAEDLVSLLAGDTLHNFLLSYMITRQPYIRLTRLVFSAKVLFEDERKPSHPLRQEVLNYNKLT